MARKNPVERKIDDLAAQWNEFIENEDGRILRWITDQEGAKLLNVFLEFESGEAGQLPDLFIRFRTPFEWAGTYDDLLTAELVSQYDQMIEEQAAEKEDSGAADHPNTQDTTPGENESRRWVHPDGDSSIVESAASFLKAHEGVMDNLACVLLPDSVDDPDEWAAWLRENLEREDWPNGVRCMIVDLGGSQALDELEAEFAGKLVSESIDCNPAELAKQIATESGNSGPGAVFQRDFSAMNLAASKGNLSSARTAGHRAAATADKEGWPSQKAAVWFSLGAAALLAGEDEEALEEYRKAEMAAHEAGEEKDPASPALLLHSLLAQAAVHVKTASYADAADTYERTVPVAEESGNLPSVLDCWRMAGFCHERLADTPATDKKTNGEDPTDHLAESWERVDKALAVAAEIEASERDNTTLTYAAAAMLRLIEQAPFPDRRDGLEERFAELMGPDWRQKVEDASS